jgi:hypothetical protein
MPLGFADEYFQQEFMIFLVVVKKYLLVKEGKS